jgi:hypothetical protein
MSEAALESQRMNISRFRQYLHFLFLNSGAIVSDMVVLMLDTQKLDTRRKRCVGHGKN